MHESNTAQKGLWWAALSSSGSSQSEKLHFISYVAGRALFRAQKHAVHTKLDLHMPSEGRRRCGVIAAASLLQPILDFSTQTLKNSATPLIRGHCLDVLADLAGRDRMFVHECHQDTLRHLGTLIAEGAVETFPWLSAFLVAMSRCFAEESRKTIELHLPPLAGAVRDGRGRLRRGSTCSMTSPISRSICKRRTEPRKCSAPARDGRLTFILEPEELTVLVATAKSQRVFHGLKNAVHTKHDLKLYMSLPSHNKNIVPSVYSSLIQSTHNKNLVHSIYSSFMRHPADGQAQPHSPRPPLNTL